MNPKQPTLRILTDRQRSAIAEAATELLERVGVHLTEPEAQELLHRAGTRVDGDQATIPAQLVEAAIKSAPRGILIYSRRGELAMQLEGHNIYFGAHTDAPDMPDPADPFPEGFRLKT
jgi:trimethylamine--corrinoid protein Co-methyltransferase